MKTYMEESGGSWRFYKGVNATWQP